MLSFTIAHISIIRLRQKLPDQERPYKAPLNFRYKGSLIPLTAVIGGMGTFLAWVAVTVLHPEARVVGIPWMIIGCAGYVLYRRSKGLSITASYRLSQPERPADFEQLAYRTALVPIFGSDISADALSDAARLIGEEGVVYAVYVLVVPQQLSLEIGLADEEAAGRRVLESARLQAKRRGIKIETGLIRTRSAGQALVDEAEKVGCDVIYWSTIHAPSDEQGIGPTASYLLSRRPCRIIIESENRARPQQQAAPVPV